MSLIKRIKDLVYNTPSPKPTYTCKIGPRILLSSQLLTCFLTDASISRSQPSSPKTYHSDSTLISQQMGSQVQHSHINYTNHPISPPISAGLLDSKGDSPKLQSLVIMASAHKTQTPIQQTLLIDALSSNPSSIFK